jgi:uncharacterized membrane protein YeaQ/YmgE (transglycosylase-associated protein family)
VSLLFAWIVLGLLAGFIASKLLSKSDESIFPDLELGIVGAVVGGFLFQTFGMTGVSGLNGVDIYSIPVAVVGAVVFLAIYHVIFSRRT